MATVVASRNCSLTTSALRLSSRTLAISSKGLNHNATRRTLQRSITLGRPTSVFQQEQSLSLLSNAPTTRTASTSANSSTTPTPTASPSNQATLTWDEFLKLRRTRRYVNLGASLFSGVGAIAVATPLIAEYIRDDSRTHEIKEALIEDNIRGMHTFDQNLVDLYKHGLITMDEAMDTATSPNELKLMVTRSGIR